MAGINKVIIIGNVGSVDVKPTKMGNKLANLSVATSEKYTAPDGQKVENTEWHKVTLFAKLADLVEQYVKKGDKIYIEGKLKTEKYNKDGVDHYVTKIIAQNIQFLGSKDGQQRNDDYQKTKDGSPMQRDHAMEAENEFNDDIPF